MKKSAIAVLTSKDSWFLSYAERFCSDLRKKGYKAKLFNNLGSIGRQYEIVFILSFFKMVSPKFLSLHKHNLVVHESDLPKGKGWAPLFWQILEGKNKIPVVIFEASEKVDGGKIYLKDYISCKGNELYDELRKKQALKTIEMCWKFIKKYPRVKGLRQKGIATSYRKRVPKDSELDINKPLKSQVNLLRIVNNKDFPAFFYYKKDKFILEIYKVGKGVRK